METVRVLDALQRPPGSDPVRVQGWVRTKRDSKGGFSFIEINDGSCLKGLQIVAEGSLENYASEVLAIGTGCSLSAEGLIVESQGRGQTVELHADRIRVLGLTDPDAYPLQKKRHSFEFLRQIAHLRARTNTFGAVCRVRNLLSRAVHDFFQDQGFFYVHTPLITPMDCEGAGELFRVTTFDPDELAGKVRGGVDFGEDFFGCSTYLTVSGQLEAEALACALGRVYTFGPTFRAENSNTARHLSEFWMVEPEIAFCDLNQDMDLAEAFLKSLIDALLSKGREDMEFFDERIQSGILETLKQILESEFRRIPYDEAIRLLSASSKAFEYPTTWGHDLQTEHERYLTEEIFQGPVIVYNYPSEIKPFYMYENDDARTVRAMDVLVPRTGELIGGSQREDRFEVLKARMQEKGVDSGAYGWYLDLRRFGSVPHAGFGLGFERLVQFVTGMANIRDVIPFPRTPKNALF
jgi:asparaginyl-tRNA synthetase